MTQILEQDTDTVLWQNINIRRDQGTVSGQDANTYEGYRNWVRIQILG
jgi:hypothetical protein